jgi:uncharacterized membrane protein YbaN (DUF454 family)
MRFLDPRKFFHHSAMGICHAMEIKTTGADLMNIKKLLYIIFGCIGVGLGTVGAIIPMLPTVPFLMLAAFCFARSSEKLSKWFKNTQIYKNNLEDYVAGRGMTWKNKIRIMITVTLLMSFGFAMMVAKGIVVGCIVLGCVWLFHILHFCFEVKTISDDDRIK